MAYQYTADDKLYQKQREALIPEAIKYADSEKLSNPDSNWDRVFMARMDELARAAGLFNKTKPCPWCDHDDTIQMYSSYGFEGKEPITIWQVKCSWCGACGPTDANEVEAIKAWNER